MWFRNPIDNKIDLGTQDEMHRPKRKSSLTATLGYWLRYADNRNTTE